jgi:hypothetical protein
MAYNRELPTGFINAVDGYIDFALTLLDLSKCSGEEIFAGSLAALKRSKDI